MLLVLRKGDFLSDCRAPVWTRLFSRTYTTCNSEIIHTPASYLGLGTRPDSIENAIVQKAKSLVPSSKYSAMQFKLDAGSLATRGENEHVDNCSSCGTSLGYSSP